MNESSAATTKLNVVPAVMTTGKPLIARCVAAAELTTTLALVPVTLLLFVSVAVSVWPPAVLRVTMNVPTPLVNVASAGNTACPSLLVK